MTTALTPPPYLLSAAESGRTSRDLYAEARRYENWSRNIRDGRTEPVDSDGRVWTVREIQAHVGQLRRAGWDAEQAENAALQAEEDAQRRLPRRLPERVVMAALVDATTELAYIERDEQLAADVAREIEMAGGANDVPAIPPLPPVEPKADDIVVHLATRRIQDGYEFGSAA